MIEITLPQIDENVVEYTIGMWLKQPGDMIVVNEPLVEVETDKVTMEVTAETAGRLGEILAQQGDVLQPGEILARLEPADMASPIPQKDEAATAQIPRQAKRGNSKRLSPVVGRMLAEHGVSAEQISGTGKNGRVTKKDVLAFLDRDRPTVSREQWPVADDPAPESDSIVNRKSEIVNLSPMRRSIAEHMVRSLATSPHVTTVFEFDFHAVAQHRAKHKAAFAADGVKLTYMAYLSLATVQALKKFPLVNSQFHEAGIELKKEINLGMIVAVPDGLYAPVIHHADEYNLKGLARAIGDVSEKSHAGELKPADLQGGTFTISNHGAAGSIAGTPIIFQPQAGILGVGAIEDRVKVINKGMHIRPCAYISFSFDHRIMDGAISDGFCSEIKRIIESWPEE